MTGTRQKSAPARRHACRLALLLWLGLAGGGARAELALTDDAGQRVVLARPAQRIISLAPHITELVFAAGAGDKLVGGVDFSDYPDAARQLPRIGGHAAFDLERIARLKPDLALVWGSGNPPGQVAQLRRMGIPVFVSEPRRPGDIATSLRQIGRLADVPAEAVARDFEQRLAALRQRYANAPVVSVFYEIWNQPLMTIGGGHALNDAITLCGGRNVFAALPQPAANIDVEAVLRADPEVIVASGMDRERPEWLDDWRRWARLKAVRRNALSFVPPELLQRQTPRLLEGIERLCDALDAARERPVRHGVHLGK